MTNYDRVEEMNKYIKLELLLKELEENTPYNWSDEDYEQGEVNGYKYAVSIVEAQDTADVAEVVSCKDCKYLMFSDCYGECSRGYLGIVLPDDYCSRGERKDGVKNDR